MKIENPFGGNLYINFTPEEVQNYLERCGYTIREIVGEGPTRHITSMEGGEVNLSDTYKGMVKRIVAVNRELSESEITAILEDEYQYRPDYVFKELIKFKLLS